MINKLKNPDLGLLLIRVGLALVFIIHGWGKWQNLDGTVGFFGGLGLAAFFAYLVATVEVLAGLAMLLGVWVDWAGLLLAAVMFTAIYLVKFDMGFVGGYEFDLMLLLSALGVAMMGSGAYTINGWMKKLMNG